ncbi:MAG: Rieske (2Fe-2S) protein, partial [Sphingomonadales bacterium]
MRCEQRGPTMIANAQDMRALRLGLFRRVLDHARAGTTDLAADVMHIDPATYHDEQNFERERIRLFRETPLLVCLSCDLPEPGSFRLFDDTGLPIVVVRGTNGEVRAFLNICRHRGGRIVDEASGRAGRFTCGYHGWTYDTAGKVIGVPAEPY